MSWNTANQWPITCVMMTALVCGGCETASVEEVATSNEEAIAVDSESSDISTAHDRSTTVSRRESSNVAAVPTAPALPSVALMLNVGDRFPLRKTVEQQLTQPAPDGKGVSMSRSFLELLLALTVEELRTGPEIPRNDPRLGYKRLSVRYSRVRFEQQLVDHTIRYDSANPPAQVPVEALGYHGLAHNTFQFWMDADNQIREMIGFDAFIERCLEPVAPEKRELVRAMLVAGAGADGVANFVDDSIGILPGTAVREGDSWNRSRTVLQPVPLRVDNRYTLRQFDQGRVHVEIVGSIRPSLTFRPAEEQTRDVEVNIRKGHVFGHCVVDQRTGLPVEATVNQEMDMRVRLASGSEFDQRKLTTTNVTVFSAQNATEISGDAPAAGTIQPVSGVQSSPAGGPSQRPANAIDRSQPIRTSDVFPAEARSVIR